MSKTPSRNVWWPFVWVLALGGAAAGALVSNQELREWVYESLKTIFVIVTTPFIFETTVALVGILALLAFNHWRLHKDGDGWVYLMDQSDQKQNLPKALTERLHNVMLTEKPEVLDEAQARRSVIEGFLELGMGAQALEEFESGEAWADDGETARLRVRVLAANADTTQAQGLLHHGAGRFPNERALFSRAALEVARWSLRHLQRTDLATLWLGEAIQLDPSTPEALASGDPLRSILAA